MPEYDPSQFYIHATDKRGHSLSVRFALPPDQHHHLMKIVHDARYPYDTPQDFVRDAVVHRLASLAEADDNASVAVTVFMLANQAAARVAVMEASESLLSSYRDLASRAGTSLERKTLLEDVKEVLGNAAAMGISSTDIMRFEDLKYRLMD